VVFVALYASLLGLWFALLPLLGPVGGGRLAPMSPRAWRTVLQRRLFAVAGAVVGSLAAVLAYYAPASVMHRNLGAVTPILRDNFWLAVTRGHDHGQLCVGGHRVDLGQYRVGLLPVGPLCRTPPAEGPVRSWPASRIRPSKLPCCCWRPERFSAPCGPTRPGAAFWAWDPKEVWALIPCWCMSSFSMRDILDGRAISAWPWRPCWGHGRPVYFWYGVNFLLGSGMHSYGSGAGGQWQVATAVGLEWLFLSAAGLRYAAEEGKQDLHHGVTEDTERNAE